MTLFKRSFCKQKVVLAKLLYRCSCGHVEVLSESPGSPVKCRLCGSDMLLASASSGAEEPDKDAVSA